MEEFKAKTLEQYSQNIVNLFKNENFSSSDIDLLISKLKDLKTDKEPNVSKDVEIAKTESKLEAEKLQMEGESLIRSFPEYQANTRNEVTHQILDYAAKMYKAPPYNQGIETSKYIS